MIQFLTKKKYNDVLSPVLVASCLVVHHGAMDQDTLWEYDKDHTGTPYHNTAFTVST